MSPCLIMFLAIALGIIIQTLSLSQSVSSEYFATSSGMQKIKSSNHLYPPFIVSVASLHLHTWIIPQTMLNICFSLHIYVKEVRSKIRVSCRESWFLLLCPWSFKFSFGAIFILPGEPFLEFILEQVCWQQILFTSLHWRVSLFCLNFWRIFNGYWILGWHLDSVST